MSASTKCPKCGFTANSPIKECPRCGVIISKFLHKAKGDRQADSRDATRKNSGLENLARANALAVRQHKEWGEILTGFETKNKYGHFKLNEAVLSLAKLPKNGAVWPKNPSRMPTISVSPFPMESIFPRKPSY